MNPESYLYHYRAEVVSVYDGDTIRVNIDLGFGLTNRGSAGKGVSVRLHGINAPELRGKEKVEGKKSQQALEELLLGKTITLKTIRDTTGKFGRYLGIILLEDGTNVNEWLITEGLAKEAKY